MPPGYSKMPSFVDRAEAFFTARAPIFMLRSPSKLEHHIHHMLQHPGPAIAPPWSHGPQGNRAAVVLAYRMSSAALSRNLAHAAGGLPSRGDTSSGGVHHAKNSAGTLGSLSSRILAFSPGYADRSPKPKPFRAELDLPADSSRCIEHPPPALTRLAHTCKRRGLPIPDRPPQDERALHTPPPSTRLSWECRCPHRLRAGFDFPKRQGAGARAAPLLHGLRGCRLGSGCALLQCVPGAAFRAFSVPSCSFLSAGRSAKLGFRLRHQDASVIISQPIPLGDARFCRIVPIRFKIVRHIACKILPRRHLQIARRAD